jgi:hypothetical protein
MVGERGRKGNADLASCGGEGARRILLREPSSWENCRVVYICSIYTADCFQEKASHRWTQIDTDKRNVETNFARNQVEFQRLALPGICVHLCSSVANPAHQETSGRRICCRAPRGRGVETIAMRRTPTSTRLPIRAVGSSPAKPVGPVVCRTRPAWSGGRASAFRNRLRGSIQVSGRSHIPAERTQRFPLRTGPGAENEKPKPPIHPAQSESSTSGIRENTPHVGLYSRLRPVGMLRAHAGGLHFARGPIQTPRHPQPFLAGHGAEDFDLFCAGLFICQHGLSMRYRGHWRKQHALGPSFC